MVRRAGRLWSVWLLAGWAAVALGQGCSGGASDETPEAGRAAEAGASSARQEAVSKRSDVPPATKEAVKKGAEASPAKKEGLQAGMDPSSPNDYFKNAEARRVIDRIIEAYGGREKIEAVDRVRIVTRIKAEGQEMILTLYQTPTALRRDMLSEASNTIQCYAGGEDGWMRQDGALMSPPGETLQFLKYEIAKGVLQQPMLRSLTSPDRRVRFKGRVDFKDRPCYLIETGDVLGRGVDHYFDVSTLKKVAEVTHDEHGSVTQLFEAYEPFEGVLFARRAVVLDVGDNLRGTMEVVRIDSDFGDSVFARPAP